MDDPKTSFRHDLGERAVVASTHRMGDDASEIVAVTFDDDAVRIGIRLRTVDQALELVRVAKEALAILEEIEGGIRFEEREPEGDHDAATCPVCIEVQRQQAVEQPLDQPGWVG